MDVLCAMRSKRIGDDDVDDDDDDPLLQINYDFKFSLPSKQFRRQISLLYRAIVNIILK